MHQKLSTFWTSLNRTIPVNQRELVLGLGLCALAGLAAGMLLSPRKTIAIGFHNSSSQALREADQAPAETKSHEV